MAVVRPRSWPPPDADFAAAVLGFLQFLHDTAVNKVIDLGEAQAGATPLSSSPAMSPLGVLKHLIAVQRQHIQIHIGGADLPALWNPDDTCEEFRLHESDSVTSVVAALDQEWERSRTTLRAADWNAFVPGYDGPVRISRKLVDVLQEYARHVGQLDLLRELIDGVTGE